MLSSFKAKYKAILFDMDGTIIMSDHAYRKAIYQALAKHKIFVPRDQEYALEKKIMGLGLDNMATELSKEFNLKISPAKLRKEIEKPVHKHLPENTHLLEGFDVFHQSLREHGVPSAIATNSDRTSFDILIKRFCFDGIFGKHLYCSNDVKGVLKPNPAIFLHSAAMVGMEPHQCVVFEDSLVGLMAAKGAGMKCVLIKNAKNHDILHLADAVIENYGEAIAAINSL